MSYSFNLRDRCPNCGGFAGAYKDNKRCRGFKHRESGYFCEVDNGTPVKNFNGYDLFYYKEEGE